MKAFEEHLDKTSEIGFVREVIGSISYVSGLPTVRPEEFVVFESGGIGQVFSLRDDVVEVLTFFKDPVKVGSRVARTDNLFQIPVGTSFLGNVLDPFGESFDHHKISERPKETRPVEPPPPGIVNRKTIRRYFETGVSIVDLMVPLGRGQRQLIIGDRKTGKSNFLHQTIISAVRQGDICIYTAIGKNKIRRKHECEAEHRGGE